MIYIKASSDFIAIWNISSAARASIAARRAQWNAPSVQNLSEASYFETYYWFSNSTPLPDEHAFLNPRRYHDGRTRHFHDIDAFTINFVGLFSYNVRFHFTLTMIADGDLSPRRRAHCRRRRAARCRLTWNKTAAERCTILPAGCLRFRRYIPIFAIRLDASRWAAFAGHQLFSPSNYRIKWRPSNI